MKKNYSLILLAACLFFIPAKTLYAQNGSLDNSFSSDGKVLTQIGPDDDGAVDVAIQADGKIVAVGGSYNVSTSNYEFAVVRYNTNGSLDNSFSSDGKLTTAFGNGDNIAFALAIQTDGKIVVGGYAGDGAMADFALVRYNTDGSLDNTFNSTGKVTTAISLNNDEISSVLIQGDGKIIVAGSSNNDFAVARYNSNGTLDMTFNGQGWIRTDFNGGGDFAYGAALQADGKIVAVGHVDISSISNFGLARYNSNGTLDNTFSSDGKANVLIGIEDAVAYDVALQADGKIILAGHMYNGSDDDFALARFNSNGSLDNTFSSDGMLSHGILSSDDHPLGVKVQTDGKILAAGYTTTSSGYSVAVVRYNSDGSFDNSFGILGKVTTAVGGIDDEAEGMLIQPDGKIVVVGAGDDGLDDYGFIVVRYNSGVTGIGETLAGICPVNIYPNPATDYLHLDYTLTNADLVSIQLLDIHGRNMLPNAGGIMTTLGKHTENLDLQSLAPGLYYIVIWIGTEQQSFRIVH